VIAFTQSGYPVIPKYGDPRIAKTSPVNAAPGVLDELVPIFNWVMRQFDKTVTPLIAKQCWGYAPRQIRGGTGWSNHASGTAVDLNATMFPQGKRRMAAAQVAACRNIVRQSGGAIRWGGDYTGSTAVDQQHFEIASIAAARAFIARLKAKPTVQEDDMGFTEEQLRKIIREEVDTAIRSITVDTTDYSVRPPKPRKGRNIPALLGDVSNFASGAAYNAGQASIASKKALAELQEGMKE
jgi:hypothetical protein